jgi:hypothetical protein
MLTLNTKNGTINTKTGTINIKNGTINTKIGTINTENGTNNFANLLQIKGNPRNDLKNRHLFRKHTSKWVIFGQRKTKLSTRGRSAVL